MGSLEEWAASIGSIAPVFPPDFPTQLERLNAAGGFSWQSLPRRLVGGLSLDKAQRDQAYPRQLGLGSRN